MVADKIIKHTHAMHTLKQNPKLLEILFDNIQVNGPAGDQVAVITRSAAIDEEIASVGVKMGKRPIISLSTLMSDLMHHLELDVIKPPTRHGQPFSQQVIFEKPQQLLRLAAEVGVKVTGQLAENKESILDKTGPVRR